MRSWWSPFLLTAPRSRRRSRSPRPRSPSSTSTSETPRPTGAPSDLTVTHDVMRSFSHTLAYHYPSWPLFPDVSGLRWCAVCKFRGFYSLHAVQSLHFLRNVSSERRFTLCRSSKTPTPRLLKASSQCFLIYSYSGF